MNFKKLAMLGTLASLAVGASGCYVSSGYGYNYCYYDSWGYYVCDYYYYNEDGSVETSRDVINDVANADQEKLETIARHYSDKFSLSDEQGMKLARAATDFSALENRSEQDLADFARRLYGLNPSEIVSAVGAAQAGNSAQLNSLVDQAAANFGVKSDKMKSIVKTFHGKALEAQGVRL